MAAAAFLTALAALAGSPFAQPPCAAAPDPGGRDPAIGACSVSGHVLNGTVAVPDMRVSAIGTDGISVAWALTDADGRFSLSGLPSGALMVGAARPGYTAVSTCLGTLAPGTTLTGLALQSTPLYGRLAPTYDDFTGSGDSWRERWSVTSLSPSPSEGEPKVSLPGRDLHPGGSSMDGAVTVEGGTALMSAERFHRYASVTAARLVSALASEPVPTGVQPDAVLRLQGADGGGYLEVAAAGYTTYGGQQRIQYLVRGAGPTVWGGGPVPTAHSSLGDITADSVLVLTVARTGTFHDIYLNNIRVFSANLPGALTSDHFAILGSTSATGATTWDWLQSAPSARPARVAGDLNRNGTVDTDDAVRALRLAAGLTTAHASDAATGDVESGDGAVTLADALAILRAMGGAGP